MLVDLIIKLYIKNIRIIYVILSVYELLINWKLFLFVNFIYKLLIEGII